MEKMLVCEALDERDFLRKKIRQAILNVKFVEVKRKKDAKIGGATMPSDFIDSATRSYQQLQDWIKRYNALDNAITVANASTMIKTRSGKEMTRASAIALKKRVKGGTDFITDLYDKMKYNYDEALIHLRTINNRADAEADKYRSNLTSKDGEISKDSADMIDKLTENLYGELIDPLNLDGKIEKMLTEHDAMLSEIEMAVKVSNATTFVEFEV